jgi:hypothetical protein
MKTRPLQSKKHVCTLDTDIHQKNAKYFCPMWRMSVSEQSQAVSLAYAHMVPGKSVRQDWISEPDQCKTRSIAAHWIVRSIKGLLKLCVCVCTNLARKGRRAGLGFRTRSRTNTKLCCISNTDISQIKMFLSVSHELSREGILASGRNLTCIYDSLQ